MKKKVNKILWEASSIVYGYMYSFFNISQVQRTEVGGFAGLHVTMDVWKAVSY